MHGFQMVARCTGMAEQERRSKSSLAEATEKGQTKGNASPSSGAGACRLPTMLEVLGDHLYAKLEELSEADPMGLDVAKLTGILLELGEQEVLKMLQDERHLQKCVMTAVEHVPSIHRGVTVPPVGSTDEDVAETLYTQVHQLEPALSAQITGMLLEAGTSQVRPLLSSPSKVRQAVASAKATLLSHKLALEHRYTHSEDSESGSSTALPRGSWTSGSMANQKCQNSSDSLSSDVEEEELGETVYAEAVKYYPDHASKITGMVLEMDTERVAALIQDLPQLHKIFEIAFKTLQEKSHGT